VILKFAILIALITATLQAAPSKSKAIRELGKIPSYQEGAKAMADLLPDLAIQHFRSTLNNKKLSTNARSFATLALAEALIRSSITSQGSDEEATAAIQLLTSNEVKDQPSTPIWYAEALAALGRYQEAESALAKLTPTHPRHREILLARARILIALNRTDYALKILTELANLPPLKPIQADTCRHSAQLLAAEILLDQGKYDAAQATLEKLATPNQTVTQLKGYLKARLALVENQPADAISRFKSLVIAPEHLHKRIYNACVLGLADALNANHQKDDAIFTLLEYISAHPNSMILQPAFQRLSLLLPANLPADDPSMRKLTEWSKESPLIPNALYVVGDSTDAIRPYQPAPSEYDDLYTLALYLRAQLLARSNDPGKNQRAISLLLHLRLQHPAHNPPPPSELYLQVSSASLLDTAEIQLKRKQTQQAAFTLGALAKVAFSPRLKDQASLLRGLLLTKENQYKEAKPAFDFARESSSEDIATAASINSGIIALLSSNLEAFSQILKSTNLHHVSTALKLERALWKCRNNDISGRADLETFIMAHMNHPRENEARMALAAACVDINPPDIALTNAQLDIIASRMKDATSQYGITRIRIRAYELSQNWTDAAATAEAFIRDYKDDPHVPGLMLKQGEAYYHNEDFNKARRIFQNVTTQFPDSPFAPYAHFYTAMAARLGGTTQAREESIKLFKKIIQTKHPLATEARIQQSRVLIDLRSYSEAELVLKPILNSKTTSASQRRDAGVLLADCLHRQGAGDPKKYAQAFNIYNELLKSNDIPLAKKNQFHFLQGQTLESMNRRAEALDSYYTVIANENTLAEKDTIEIEWFWFYRCGFKALSMLEADHRWESAVKLARRIATFNGPRSEEASKRAHNLAKQHMIWEEEKTPPQAIEVPNNE